MSLLAIPLMGLFVSFVSVFLGLGGGILLVPLLPTVFGLSVHEAVATSLLTIVCVVSENTFRFHKDQLVRWPVVLTMGPISAITAVIAAKLTQSVNPRYILMALVVLLVLVALKTLFSSFLKKPYVPVDEMDTKTKVFSVSAGALAGLTSGFAGVGSGVILGPSMIFLRTVKPEELGPSSNGNMMFTTMAASLTFLATGSYVAWNQWGLVRWDLALGVFVSASIFSRFLRPHQSKMPFKLKSLLLAILLMFLIFKLVNKLLIS